MLLGNFIGKFLEYDDSNYVAVWRQFMRIRVVVDVDIPLKRCKRIKRPDGSSFVVSFKYEKFICGRLGHSESFCGQLFTSHEGEIKKEWGAWLKANDRRSQLSVGGKWLRSEEGADSGKGVHESPAAGNDRRGKDIFYYG